MLVGLGYGSGFLRAAQARTFFFAHTNETEEKFAEKNWFFIEKKKYRKMLVV